MEESGSAITVLDAIVGQTRASLALSELLGSHQDAFNEAFAEDPSGDQAQGLLWELEFQSQLNHNPICRKSMQLFQRLPIDPGYCISFLRDRNQEGFVGIKRSILGGIDVSQGKSRHQVLLSASVYLRDLGGAAGLADQIAEYCLARKAIREVGTDWRAWNLLISNTPWIEDSATGGTHRE